MINGEPNDFLDVLYTGQNIQYKYKGIKYWYQGYHTEKGFHMEVIEYERPGIVVTWEVDRLSSDECKEAFLKAPIFGGKTFWEAESEIEWFDD